MIRVTWRQESNRPAEASDGAPFYAVWPEFSVDSSEEGRGPLGNHTDQLPRFFQMERCDAWSEITYAQDRENSTSWQLLYIQAARTIAWSVWADVRW